MPNSQRRLLLMFGLPALLIAGTLVYYVLTEKYVSTDNAYVKQDKVSVSAEVSGVIIDARVSENQQVRSGDLLFLIDPEPYQLTVDEAAAAVATAAAHLEELQAAVLSSEVKAKKAEQDIAYYQKEYQRQKALLKTSVTSEANLQSAEHALEQAQSELATARAEIAEDKAAVATGESAVNNAKVQLAKAKLNLERTEVRSPATGIVSQADRLKVGQLMVQSLPAVTIVINNRSWVEANFKETDLDNMRIGQPAEITVDTYPDLKLQGRVESIGAGTGSEFSILPAQNATANWVKVTQRVPVRITILDKSARPLIAGLSVNVTVDTSQ